MGSKNVRVIECGHCSNKSPMPVEAEYTRVESFGGTPPYCEEAFTRWNLRLCPACDRPILEETTWDTLNIDPENGPEYETKVLYPLPAGDLGGLPDRVHKAYLAALRVRNVEPNAFAVLIGRTLECICSDRSAVGRNLDDKLKDLSQRQEIPGRLFEMAQKLRALRNIGAHADDDEITEEDVPILIAFTDSILDYVYRAPGKLEALRKRIEEK